MPTFYSPSGNPEVWEEKPEGYLTVEEWQAKQPVPEPYIPSQKELYQQELAEKQAWLIAHDYVGTKIATGRATKEEYAEVIAKMTEYADRVNLLQEWLNANP